MDQERFRITQLVRGDGEERPDIAIVSSYLGFTIDRLYFDWIKSS